MKPISKKVAARLNGLHKEFNRSRSLTEISTLLGIPKSTYNSYLRGLALPPVPIAQKILNLTMNNTNDLE
ncbi:helix-turn-helix domain-containing protein [Pseudobacillus sp. 179-B 2D1 NHS]|uniref:helix-turn-helix domain-containing protein n=1 Tax=Pseudobacillus sp. 179-B 2D1 NHS TaxID=3374292 RepID=UPI003878F985